MKKRRGKWFGVCLVLMVAILGFAPGWLAGKASTNATNSSFAIHYLDVGQADAAIVLCDGKVMMIDGGNSADSSFVYSYLRNTLGIEHIDYMVATHPHVDHIGGLSGALNACSVGMIYSPVSEYESKAFTSLKKYADKQGLSLTIPTLDQRIPLGTASFEFLSPRRKYDDTNDQSLVLKITYGQISFLFTGDAEWNPEHDMIDDHVDLLSTVLKVGHHGSDTSTSYVFLREVNPSYAIISVGSDNKYGHPTEAVLSRLRDADVTIYRTDLQGTIICQSDGKQVSFSTERNTGNSLYSSAENKAQDSADYTYVLNTKSKKFHFPECKSVRDMKESNKAYSNLSRSELIEQGYSPCGNCKP